MTFKFLADAQRVQIPAKSRAIRVYDPRLIIIHATRGPTSPEQQFGATINWFQMGGGAAYPSFYGPSADILVGYGGEHAVFTDGHGRDFRQTRANWSAGFGESGAPTEFGADEYAITVEIAQSAWREPYSPASRMKAVAICAELCAEYRIPVQRLGYLDQSNDGSIPAGFVGHEDTENGRKTGKSDPGDRFPWQTFLEEVRASMQPKPEPAPVLGTPIPPRIDDTDELDAMHLVMALRGRRTRPVLGGYQEPLHYTRDGRPVYEIVLPE